MDAVTTPEDIRKEWETNNPGMKWWTNPVSHGEFAFASWEYQEWLERQIIALIQDHGTLTAIISKLEELMKENK